MCSHLIEFLQCHLIIGEDVTIREMRARMFRLEMVLSSFSVEVGFSHAMRNEMDSVASRDKNVPF